MCRYHISRRDDSHRLATYARVGSYTSLMAMVLAITKLITFHPQTRFLIEVEPQKDSTQ